MQWDGGARSSGLGHARAIHAITRFIEYSHLLLMLGFYRYGSRRTWPFTCMDTCYRQLVPGVLALSLAPEIPAILGLRWEELVFINRFYIGPKIKLHL